MIQNTCSRVLQLLTVAVFQWMDVLVEGFRDQARSSFCGEGRPAGLKWKAWAILNRF